MQRRFLGPSSVFRQLKSHLLRRRQLSSHVGGANTPGTTGAAASTGILRFKIAQSPQFSGIRSTRGTREFNEDRYQRATLRLSGSVEAVYVAVFDGHGGSRASDFCAANLHRNIQQQFENKLSAWRTTTAATATDGGTPDFPNLSSDTGIDEYQKMMEAAVTEGFLETDRTFLAEHDPDSFDGTTASIAILLPLQTSTEAEATTAIDEASATSTADVTTSFFASPRHFLTVGHVGDSRILLCDSATSKAQPLTVDHNPSLREERERVEREGGVIATDSFGSHAINGMLAITRSIGVARLKKGGQTPSGLTAVPQVMSRLLEGNEAFLTLVTDGLTCVMSNQEIVDVVKMHKDPTAAAIALVTVAEAFGTNDNSTALVVRLHGWPMHQIPNGSRDFTGNLRRLKMRNALNNVRGNSSAIEQGWSSSASGEEKRVDCESKTLSASATSLTLVPVDRFIVDLFDVMATDMEKDAGILADENHFGRLSRQQVREGINALNVEFVQNQEGSAPSNTGSSTTTTSSPSLSTRPIKREQVIKAIFQEKRNSKVSAAELKQALDRLAVCIWKRQFM